MAEKNKDRTEDRAGRSSRMAALEARIADTDPTSRPSPDEIALPEMPTAEGAMPSPMAAALDMLTEAAAEVPPEFQDEFQLVLAKLGELVLKIQGGPAPEAAAEPPIAGEPPIIPMPLGGAPGTPPLV